MGDKGSNDQTASCEYPGANRRVPALSDLTTAAIRNDAFCQTYTLINIPQVQKSENLRSDLLQRIRSLLNRDLGVVPH